MTTAVDEIGAVCAKHNTELLFWTDASGRLQCVALNRKDGLFYAALIRDGDTLDSAVARALSQESTP